jgi:hypothetical protein
MRLVYTFDFEFTHNGWPQNIKISSSVAVAVALVLP